MQKNMKSLDKLKLLQNCRKELFSKLLDRKISGEQLVNSSFQFLNQHKIKPIAKAHDIESVYLNYYYWTIQIERKIMLERRLIEMKVGSVEKLFELTEVLINRRDRMIRILLWEMDVKPKDAYLVFGDTVELVMDDHVLYSSKESLDKIRFKVQKLGKSLQEYYLAFLDIRQEVEF